MSMFRSLWSAYEGWLGRSPLVAKSVTTAVLSFAGDVIAQNTEKYLGDDREKRFDWYRSARLTGFGLVYVGPMLHGWYASFAAGGYHC